MRQDCSSPTTAEALNLILFFLVWRDDTAPTTNANDNMKINLKHTNSATSKLTIVSPNGLAKSGSILSPQREAGRGLAESPPAKHAGRKPPSLFLVMVLDEACGGNYDIRVVRAPDQTAAERAAVESRKEDHDLQGQSDDEAGFTPVYSFDRDELQFWLNELINPSDVIDAKDYPESRRRSISQRVCVGQNDTPTGLKTRLLQRFAKPSAQQNTGAKATTASKQVSPGG